MHSMYAFHLFEIAILSSRNYFHIVVTAEFFILFCHKSICGCCHLVAKSYPTLFDLMDCNTLGSSILY